MARGPANYKARHLIVVRSHQAVLDGPFSDLNGCNTARKVYFARRTSAAIATSKSLAFSGLARCIWNPLARADTRSSDRA